MKLLNKYVKIKLSYQVNKLMTFFSFFHYREINRENKKPKITFDLISMKIVIIYLEKCVILKY